MKYEAKMTIQKIGAEFLQQAAIATELRDFPILCAKAKKSRKKAPSIEAHEARLNSIRLAAV